MNRFLAEFADQEYTHMTVIGISMGGLVGLHALASLEPAPRAAIRFVSLGSPLAGRQNGWTRLQQLVVRFVPLFRQLDLDSSEPPTLRDLYTTLDETLRKHGVSFAGLQCGLTRDLHVQTNHSLPSKHARQFHPFFLGAGRSPKWDVAEFKHWRWNPHALESDPIVHETVVAFINSGLV
jgi:hypothetical protein